MVKLTMVLPESSVFQALSSQAQITEEAIRKQQALTKEALSRPRELTEQALDRMIDLLASGQSLSRLPGMEKAISPPPEISKATDEVISKIEEVFEPLPWDRIEVELISEDQLYRERLGAATQRGGPSLGIEKVILPDLGKNIFCVSEKGSMEPRVVDGEWRYKISVVSDNLSGVPDYKKRIGHEFGHIPQFEAGALGRDTKRYYELETDLKEAWENLYRLAYPNKNPGEPP